MNLAPNRQRLVYELATLVLLIAIAALWVPTSWQAAGNRHGEWVGAQASVTHVGLGALKPLRLTWESSANGFWLSLTGIRLFPLSLSVTLTVAAAIVAAWTYRLRSQPRPGA
jgi:hypothetical protein